MKSFVLFFVITCVGAAFAVPKTNVVKTVGAGDVTISCPDASSWRFSAFPARTGDGREVVTVRLDSSEEAVPPMFDLFFHMSGADVFQVWTPFDERCQLWPLAWGNARTWARFRGIQNGCKYAETFQAHRIHGYMPDFKVLP